ncbi:MAG: hypothetical protein E7K72_18295 [Roseomonas mucosa]|nr:hypothetical protein [Roseomonas mucosa]
MPVPDVLPSQLHRVAAAHARVEHQRQSEARLTADGPVLLELPHLLDSPSVEALATSAEVRHRLSRVRRHRLHGNRMSEHRTQGFQQAVGSLRLLRPLIPQPPDVACLHEFRGLVSVLVIEVIQDQAADVL